MAISVNPSAQPAGTRVSIVASVHTIVSATTRPRVSCHSATRHASVATDQAALHTYTSWYTHGSDAMYMSADPPSTDATITANPNASKRPTGAVPRISRRTSAVRRTSANASTSAPSSIDGAVRRPSSRSVSNSSGIRNSAGKGGK